MNYIILLSAVYLLFTAFTAKTKNLQSSIYFRFIPFLLGLGCLIYSLKQFQLI